MTGHSITLRVTLDRPPTEEEAYSAALKWADPTWLTYVHSASGEAWLSVTAAVAASAASAEHGVVNLMESACHELRHVLAQHGLKITGWDLVSAQSAAETDRRLLGVRVPPMVSAVELADLCGVTPARIYELEGERRKAAERGERHALPAPVVPGYWLRTVAEHYAATRKRKPGPTSKSA